MRILLLGSSLLLLATLAAACGEEEFAISAVQTNSPVEPNEFANVTAQVGTGAVCILKVGEIVNSDGKEIPRTLPPKSPNHAGVVTFRFGIPQTATPQAVPVNLSCVKNNVTVEAGATVEVGKRTKPFRTPLPTASPTPTP